MLPTPMRCFRIIWRNFLPEFWGWMGFWHSGPVWKHLDHTKAQVKTICTIDSSHLASHGFSQRRCWFKNNGHVSGRFFCHLLCGQTMLNLWHRGFHHESWTIYIHPILRQHQPPSEKVHSKMIGFSSTELSSCQVLDSQDLQATATTSMVKNCDEAKLDVFSQIMETTKNIYNIDKDAPLSYRLEKWCI